MLQNIELRTHKALKAAKLLELGQINVICGRNSAGKTTVLECLTDSQRWSPGKALEESDAESIYRPVQVFNNHMRINPRENQNKEIFGYLLNLIIRELNTRTLWFRFDAQQFGKTIAEGFRASRAFSGFEVVAAEIEGFFEQRFQAVESVILLPPKRKLEDKQPIQTGNEAGPSGMGILNSLFHSKNQSERSLAYREFFEICRAFEEISEGQKFGIFTESDNTISLKFAREGQDWIPARDCGLGLQELLVILFFAIRPENEIILIEEPENHLHPEMQRRLLRYLKEETHKQYFLTTHSNVFLDNAYSDRVFFTSYDGSEIVIDDATSRAFILDDLGYSVTDNLVSDLVILVEGPKDAPILEEYLKKMGLYATCSIKIWPLGGDIMDQVDLSVFAQSYSIIALIDRDPGSKRIRNRFVENCEALGIKVVRLERYAIENYFNVRVLKEIFKGQIAADFETLDFDVPVENQLGFNIKNRNRQLARSMTLEEIEGTDFHDFLMWIGRKCSATA